MRGLCLAAVAVCAGCQSFCWKGFQRNHPQSLDEMIFEGNAARLSYPENTHTPYPGSVVSPAGPLDPQFPAPQTPPSPVADSSGTRPLATPRPTTGVRRVSASSDDGSRVVTAQGLVVEGPGARPVSDLFEDTDVRQAIQSLATQAGASIVMDEQVGGVTSALIENEPFELALRKILMPLGLVYRFHAGQYLIGTTDPASALFPMLSEEYEYRPTHVSPQELLPLIPEKLQGYVRVIEKRNLMIVEAPRDIALRIVEQLQQADEPVPQVLLEAMVCVFNPNQNFQFNADLRQSLKLNGVDVLDIGSLGMALSGFVTPIGLENAFSDFAKTSIFLRLLAQHGLITIRAAPRVMAKDGEKASISIQRETFFTLQPANADIIFNYNVQKVDAGIVLDIVPVVRGDTVTVTIEKAEVSEDTREFDRTQADLVSNFPLINRRQVSTTVHVQDGQTIVIGGLMQRQTVDRISQVPYLSSIPLLGKFFERVEQEDKAAEVAIFISPRIIRPTIMEVACPPGAVQPPATEYPGPVMTPSAVPPELLPAPPLAPQGPQIPAYMPPAVVPPAAPAAVAPPQSNRSPAPVAVSSPAQSTTTGSVSTGTPVGTVDAAPPPLPPAPLPAVQQPQMKFVMPKPAVSTSTESAP